MVELVANSAQTARGTDRPWLMVVVLTIIYMSAFVDRNILSLLAEPIKADLDLSDTEVGLLLGIAFSLFYAIFTIPAGLLVDRIGRRGILAVSAGAWSTLTVICGFSSSFWQLFAGRAGVGLSEALVTPTCFALIRDRLPATSRGRALSCLAVAPYLGAAVALIGGGALLRAAGNGAFADWPLLGALQPWQVTLVIMGLAGLPLPLLLLLVRRDDRPTTTPREINIWSDIVEAFEQIGRNRTRYILLIGYATSGSMAAFGFGAWFPTMVSRKFGMAVGDVGLTSGPILLVSAIAGLILCGLALDSLAARGRSVLLFGITANILFALAATATPLMSDIASTWLLFGAAIFFGGSFYAVGATLLAQLTPAPVMGKVSVIYLLLQSVIGGGLGPVIVAFLSDNVFSGPSSLPYALSLYCACTGLPGCMFGYLLFRSLRIPDL